jgi:predicted RNase H-like nuclease (RuvC/YqgF family)
MTPLPLLKFLKDNWVYIVIGLAIAAAIAGAVSWYNTQLEKAYDRGYSVGVADQYKEDKAKFDKMQEEHDRRVKELEKRSTELGEELDTLKQDSNAKISELNAKLDAKTKKLNQTLYDQAGKPLQTCPPVGTEYYLGPDFSSVWNSYSTGLMH